MNNNCIHSKICSENPKQRKCSMEKCEDFIDKRKLLLIPDGFKPKITYEVEAHDSLVLYLITCKFENVLKTIHKSSDQEYLKRIQSLWNIDDDEISKEFYGL